jgi:hypothetical protein
MLDTFAEWRELADAGEDGYTIVTA